jgi:hypothetical protein
MSQMLKFRLIFLTRYQRSTKGHLFCLGIRNKPEEQTTIWYHQSLVQSHSISKWRFSIDRGICAIETDTSCRFIVTHERFYRSMAGTSLCI